MKSAIEKLFYGAMTPLDGVRVSSKQKKSMEVAVECDEKLSELLEEHGEAMQLYQRFKEAADENAAMEVVAFYKEGFRNGFRLALDALEED